MYRLCDLHLHSVYSDGLHTPAELVAMAAAKGLTAIALSDHDSVAGIDEAQEAGRRFGVEVVPAVELSVEYQRYHDVHLLGYFIDHRDPELLARLSEFRTRRDERGRRIVERINRRLARQKRSGLDYDEIAAAAGETFGRPHIARALIARGYAHDMEDAFTGYLVPCNVPKQYFPMAEAISLVKRTGGVAVLAHPPSIATDRPLLRRLIGELVDLGLDGLEVFSNLCYKDDMLFFEGVAAELGLLMTGGSDFHGGEDDLEIGTGRGGLSVASRLVDDLRRLHAARSTTNLPAGA